MFIMQVKRNEMECKGVFGYALLCIENQNTQKATMEKLKVNQGIPIGKRIKEVFDNLPKSFSVQWFADSLHCDRRNIYRIFERDNIDILLLSRISRVLNHDFFLDLSSWLSDQDEEAGKIEE